MTYTTEGIPGKKGQGEHKLTITAIIVYSDDVIPVIR